MDSLAEYTDEQRVEIQRIVDMAVAAAAVNNATERRTEATPRMGSFHFPSINWSYQIVVAYSDLTVASSWSDFKDALVIYFTPHESANVVRRVLDQLTQHKPSVSSYIEQFHRLLRLIPAMDSATAVYAYLDGLEDDTRREVRLR
ncbi:hypothetical protein BGZ49_007932 [Haplosporangium sp. Z 27]|nr:hypothetical protein BGZ49_007932 [Haplosporangium sp. Z 27]